MNSENVKKNVPFLKHDVNSCHSYELIKSNKQVLNLPKEQIYNQHHSSIHDFTLNAKNNYSEYPFTGSSNWYVDFELPKLNYCYHQFVLRYKLYNNSSTDDINILPIPLMIDRLVLLKNSNVLSEVNNEDILLYNLHKISNKYNTAHNDFDYNCQLGFQLDPTNNYLTFVSPFIYKNNTAPGIVNMELPLCLTNSNFLSSAIKNDLTVRIYFKGNIVVSDIGSNSNIRIADLKLMLRMRETSHNLYKEPKFNYQFTKKILTKINMPKLELDTVYNLNITGFNSVASFAFIFIRELDNNIKTSVVGQSYLYKPVLDDVSICDNTGKNILQSDIILQRDYNRYLMSENFHQFALILNRLSYMNYNNGNLFLVPFNYDGNLSYNHGFNGGYSFKESNDYKLKFTSRFSANRSVVLNILWFTPAILDLTNGDLNEILS